MLFFLSHFLFLLQGICGSGRHGEDFRFCAERMQTEKGHLRYKSQENAISIANSASELAVSAPFSPERQQNTNISESRTWPLPELPGSYRFCVYWFQHARIFMLSYGSTKNYTLSKGAAYFLNSPNISGEATEGGTRLLFNVSYAFDKGWQNKSLPSSSAYFFRFTDSGKRRQESKSDQRSDVESEFRIAEAKLKDLEMARRLPRHGQSHNESPFVALQHLESALGAMEFQGQNKSFGEGALLRASIWKVPSRGPHELLVRSQLQEDREVRGYEVTLPSRVFTEPTASRDGRRAGVARAVLMEVTSQALFQGRNSSRVLGGKVIGISVQNRSVHNLPKDQRVAVAFQHAPLPRNETAECVFWDADATRVHLGTWNTSGCEMVPGEARTTCLCDHLTFFAVLMVYSPDIDAAHHGYLTTITYVGCLVSALASFFTVFFFLCSRRKQRDQIVWVHMHLLCAIFLLDMSFLIAVPLAPTGGEASCKAGAVLLHFAVLACLAWMGIEGYRLYQGVIEVFTSYIKHLVLKLCLVGWGFPVIIVSLIFAIDPSHYGPAPFKVYDSPGRYTDATICWITKQEINNFLNLGLLALVLLFNGLMLAAMVREILRLKQREQSWEYVVTLLGLSCVLGIPWGVVFFSFTSGTFKLVAVYLFTIINSLQGFLIFLWTLAKVLRAHRKDSMQFSNSQSVRLQSSSTTI